MARGASARRVSAAEESRPALALAAPHETKSTAFNEYADTDEVIDFAAQLPEKFLHCREMNHNWRPYTAGRHKDGGWERTLRCVRCRTLKTQHLSTNGMLIGSATYVHAEGYLHKGLGRIVGEGRGALRLESLRRAMPVGTEV